MFFCLNVLLMHRSVCKGGEPCVSEFLKTNRNAREQNSANIVHISIDLCLLCPLISRWCLLFVVSGLFSFSLCFFFDDVMFWLSKPPVPGPWWPVIMRGRQSTPENVIHVSFFQIISMNWNSTLPSRTRGRPFNTNAPYYYNTFTTHIWKIINK